MKNLKKRVITLLLAALMVFGTAVPVAEVMQPVTVSAASTVKLNKTKLTLKKGQTYQLKLNKKNAKITWSSSNKKIVSVSKKGKLTAKKAGKATITAKVGKKKYTCKVTVKNKTTTVQSAADKEKAAVLKLINKERKAQGLPALKMNSTLNAAADVRAKELTKQFSHTRPNGSSCFSILQEKKYAVQYVSAGENIAAGYASAESVMDGWMNSRDIAQIFLASRMMRSESAITTMRILHTAITGCSFLSGISERLGGNYGTDKGLLHKDEDHGLWSVYYEDYSSV